MPPCSLDFQGNSSHCSWRLLRRTAAFKSLVACRHVPSGQTDLYRGFVYFSPWENVNRLCNGLSLTMSSHKPGTSSVSLSETSPSASLISLTTWYVLRNAQLTEKKLQVSHQVPYENDGDLGTGIGLTSQLWYPEPSGSGRAFAIVGKLWGFRIWKPCQYLVLTKAT